MSFVSDIMDGVVVVGPDSTILLMNSVAEHLLCVKSFMVQGKRLSDLDGQEELIKALLEDHAKVRSEREVTRTVETHHTQHDLLYIKVRTAQLLDYHGEPAGVISVLDNVTEDFKTDQLKNQYLSIVAHELRTPLTGIKTFSTMMARRKLGELNDNQLRAVEAIREQSLRLEHQIDKLINLGYLDSDDYAQDLEVFDLHEFLVNAGAPFEAAAQERQIDLRIECPQGVEMQADRADLKRAVQALIENALKFSPENGSVLVQAELDGGDVRVLVRDEGIGIHPRYQRRIFEKFFQVEDPLTRHHGGAGLGLFVAGQILEAHGTKIEVSSELGKGAVFSFRLPTYQGEQLSPTAPETESVTASARE